MSQEFTAAQCFEFANKQLFATFPTLMKFSDNSPMLEGFFDSQESITLVLQNLSIELTNDQFVSITELDISEYLDIADEVSPA